MLAGAGDICFPWKHPENPRNLTLLSALLAQPAPGAALAGNARPRGRVAERRHAHISVFSRAITGFYSPRCVPPGLARCDGRDPTGGSAAHRIPLKHPGAVYGPASINRIRPARPNGRAACESACNQTGPVPLITRPEREREAGGWAQTYRRGLPGHPRPWGIAHCGNVHLTFF